MQNGSKTWIVAALALGMAWTASAEDIGAAVAAAAAEVSKAGSEIGQESKNVEKDLIEKQGKTREKKPKLPPEEAEQAIKNAAGAGAKDDADGAEGIAVTSVEWKGDVDLLDRYGLRTDLEAELVGKTVTLKEARKIVASYEKRLVDQGYYLAKIVVPSQAGKDGVLKAEIDQGRFGKVSLYERGEKERIEFRERFYSKEQVLKRLGIQEGAPFQYADLYNGVYTLNTHPDFLADVELRLKKKEEDGVSRRSADVDVLVDERLPLHGSFELSNSGTDLTDEWRAGLTLQHINLTRRDDILTLNIPVSLDLESIKSVALGYYLPYERWRGGAVSAYGGYSELATDDVAGPQSGISVDGEAWFVGAMWQTHVVLTPDHKFDAGFGISRRSVEDTLLLGGTTPYPRRVELAPMSLLLNYASARPDGLGGRTFANAETVVHIGEFMGSSDDEEFSLQRAEAESDYVLQRLQVARLQPFSPEKGRESWVVFGRVEGQVADGALIPAEQIAAGGISTVRGYLEREVLGDDGLIGSLELRTPIYASAVTERFFTRKPSDAGDFEKLQFVVFADGAYLSLKDPLPGETDSETLASIGAGLRFAMGKNFQSRFDWGFPLEETEESDSSGRGHVSVQFLF